MRKYYNLKGEKKMKKRLFIAIFVVICMSLLALVSSASAPAPQKPTRDVDFGTVTTIDGFTPPSELYVNTDERVLLVDEEGNYVTYPTYYVTKNNATFDFDFSKLNAAQSVEYAKKSVVMVEIPDGVTTISNSYFAGTGNFPVCVSVQFPGSVTSYGSSLFGGANTVIKVVEFLDGTEPITMGDGMFGGQWNGGANSITYVKFPNNLVSIGNNTFGKTKGASKTVIFGENLKKIGTGFFGEGTPRSTDTFMYISDKFFAEDEMFANLFGSEAPYHDNNLRLTMFYTGTKAQAEALVAKGLAVQTGYVWDENKVKIVSADEYDYNTHKPSADKSITIVYDFGKCDAFYNSVHNTVKQNLCVEACTNCGVGIISHADVNAENVTISYANGFLNVGSKHTVCTNNGCGYNVTADAPVIFQTNGYSIPEDGRGGLAISFAVDKNALAEYEALTGEAYKYGAFAVAYNNIGENDIFTMNNAVKAEIDREYGAFEMKITGFETDAHKEAKLTIGAYVIDKNGNVTYLQPNAPSDGGKYSYITYNSILNQAA